MAVQNSQNPVIVARRINTPVVQAKRIDQGKLTLNTVARGVSVSFDPGIDLKGRKRSREEYPHLKQLDEAMQDIYAAAVASAPPEAKRFKVDLKERYVVWIDENDRERFENLDHMAVAVNPILESLAHATNVAAEILTPAYSLSPNESSNRSLYDVAHQTPVSRKWSYMQPNSLQEFMEGKAGTGVFGGSEPKIGMQALESTLKQTASQLSPDDRKKAQDHIHMVEAFTQQMQTGLQRRITQLEQDLQAANNSADRKKIEENLQEVRGLEKRFANVDRLMLYTAVSVWGNTICPAATILAKKADLATHVMESLLNEELREGINERGMLTKLCDRFAKESLEEKTLHEIRPYIQRYARETGDLYLHDRGEYFKRAAQNGENPTGASIEEFILYNFIHRDDDRFDLKDPLKVFGSKDPEIPTILSDARDLMAVRLKTLNGGPLRGFSNYQFQGRLAFEASLMGQKTLQNPNTGSQELVPCHLALSQLNRIYETQMTLEERMKGVDQAFAAEMLLGAMMKQVETFIPAAQGDPSSSRALLNLQAGLNQADRQALYLALFLTGNLQDPDDQAAVQAKVDALTLMGQSLCGPNDPNGLRPILERAVSLLRKDENRASFLEHFVFQTVLHLKPISLEEANAYSSAAGSLFNPQNGVPPVAPPFIQGQFDLDNGFQLLAPNLDGIFRLTILAAVPEMARVLHCTQEMGEDLNKKTLAERVQYLNYFSDRPENKVMPEAQLDAHKPFIL